MSRSWCVPLLAAVVPLAIALTPALTSGQMPRETSGMLDEDPSIQYATRPTTDRVARLNEALARGERSLKRDARTGYLLPLLDALGVPAESQVLVFSKTGVQRAYTNPHNPRALYFDASVAVGYIPGAPLVEVAAHDPQQGVVFYTLDQAAATPVLVRRTSCLTCHVSAGTLDVPGMISRSHTTAADGTVMPQLGGTNDVTGETPHPDRWGGYFVTSEGVPAPYAQRAHAGNITFEPGGITSSQVFVDWMNSSPETRGYLSSSSDIVGLLVFDHQMHAINLLTRLNWESRIAAAGERRAGTVQQLVDELVDYFLFVREAPPSVPLTPRAGFAEHLEATVPKDRAGRSFGQLELQDRLLRYPCSYMVYSEAFDALPLTVKQAIYRRMIDVLSARGAHGDYEDRVPTADRQAVLEILADTKSDFPR